MIYQIKDSYYVKVGNKFVKLSFSFDSNDELIMTPINSEKIENNQNLIVRATTFDQEKLKIAESIRKPKSFEENKSFKDKTFKDKTFGKGKILD